MIRSGIKVALESVGYYRDRLARAPYPGVAVLAYHGVRDDAWPPGSMHFENLHVTASQLDAHLRALRALECTALSLAEWRDIAAGRRPSPPRAVLITFDDGYRNVLTRGLPVLERHQTPAAVFVSSDPVRRQVRFWFDAMAEIEGEPAVEHAKALGYREWLASTRRVELPACPGDPHAPLSIDELAQLASHPLITIGAHTDRHPILSNATHDEQRAEIQGCREALESWLDRPVDSFAYPNGRPDVDFTADTRCALGECAFRDAFAMRDAFARPEGPAFEHPRFLMLSAVGAAELAHRLAVSWPRT